MSSAIMDRILASPNLPSMPFVAVKVLELAQQDDVSINRIAEVIEKDPALTAKLLQTANSPLFGLTKKVGSIQQATVILGLRTVKIMALSFSLVEAVRESGDSLFDYQKYWRRSLTTAVVAKLVAQQHRAVRADECFVGGLLADIGMLAAFRCAADAYGPVIETFAAGPRPIQQIEAEVLGFTHAEVSARLLRRWSLPDLLCDAVAAHHGEGLAELSERACSLASLIYAASCVAELFCGDVAGQQLDEVKEQAVKLVPIAPDALEQILDDLHTHVNEMASLFRLEIGEGISHEELRNQAMAQLANISLSAEIARAEAASQAEQAQHELKELSHKAATDGLTQIANRQAFDNELAAILEASQKNGTAMGLILLDIDHFKKLNDTYGHQAGDEALRQVGQCLKSICTDTVTAARYGGEEFAVIVANATARALQRMAEGIRRRIEQIEFHHDARPIRFTASLGAAHVDLKLGTATCKEVVERADECLYDAKHNGRNRVEITF
jgi:diguanylate cyclase (GGDEF)-like protein